jgi:hypothetical protein
VDVFQHLKSLLLRIEIGREWWKEMDHLNFQGTVLSFLKAIYLADGHENEMGSISD